MRESASETAAKTHPAVNFALTILGLGQHGLVDAEVVIDAKAVLAKHMADLRREYVGE